MRLASLVILSLSMLLPGARAPGEEKRESWPDGSIKARWSEDEQGRLDGVREEYAQGGVRTLLAEYKQGRKHGAWREWSPTGARLRFLSYKEGELDGRCEEFHPDGSSASIGDQRAGARHGKWIERSADGRRRRNLERTLTAIQRNHLATRLRRAGNLPPRRSLLEPASMAEVAIQNVLLLSSVHTKVIDPAASTL